MMAAAGRQFDTPAVGAAVGMAVAGKRVERILEGDTLAVDTQIQA